MNGGRCIRVSVSMARVLCRLTNVESAKFGNQKELNLMIEVGLGHYLTLASIIFVIGIIGVFLNRKNIIIILMSIELILLAVNINLVSFSIYLQNITGQVFTMFILTVAAAEAAIGLAIIVIYFKNKGSIHVEHINSLKG